MESFFWVWALQLVWERVIVLNVNYVTSAKNNDFYGGCHWISKFIIKIMDVRDILIEIGDLKEETRFIFWREEQKELKRTA